MAEQDKPHTSKIINFGGIDQRRGSWQHWPDNQKEQRTTVQACRNLTSRDGACRLRAGLDSNDRIADQFDKWTRGLPMFFLRNENQNIVIAGKIESDILISDKIIITEV